MLKYEILMKEKINECYLSNDLLKNIIDINFKFEDKSSFVLKEIESYIFNNKEIYESNNLLKLIYESFLNLNNNRFSVFLRNLITNKPEKDRTYNHMINDIKEKLDKTYNIPSSYYNMKLSDLNRECDKLLMENKILLLLKTRQFIKDNFIINDYNSFVYENVDKAKKILKSINEDETDKTYLRIKKLLENNLGYLGVFVYFNKIEDISFARLKNMYLKILKNKDIIDRLDYDIINYMSKTGKKENFKDKDGRTYSTYFEKLYDDLTRIEEIQLSRIYSRDYPLNIRREIYNDQNFIQIIKILNDDKDKLELYNKFWIKKISRYKNKEDLIKSLSNFVYSDSNINYINNMINNDHNLRLVYNDGEIIIVRVLSFESINNIASDTSWCIKDSLSYWVQYVGSDNIQLVLFNFNLPKNSKFHKIGITLNNSKYNIYSTAHATDDSYISEEDLKKYLIKNTNMSISDLLEISYNVGRNEYYSDDEISNFEYR